jgi:molybdopterin biosynthesis enzyme
MTTMRPIRETIPLEEALDLVMEHATPLDRVERIDIREAAGRVLAREVTSGVDVPPFDRAAMDGYAVVAEDTFGAGRYDPKVLRCVEKVYTGSVPTRAVGRGECIEIATGAPMPSGADAVVMVEETEKTGDGAVRVFTPVYPRQHVGRRAADIAAGQMLMADGTLLNPSRIGALAATGANDVEVVARPRIAILSTGNEIVDPGAPLQPGQIYDINQFTLTAIIGAHGGEAVPGPTAPDSLPELDGGDRARGQRGRRRVLRRQLGRRARPDPRRAPADRRGALPRHRRQAGQAHRLRPRRPDAGARDARLSDLVSVERIHAARPAAAAHGAPARSPATDDHAAAVAAGRVDDRTAPVLYRPHRGRPGNMPAFKASGDITSMSQADGYIEIPGPDRHRRGRRAGAGETLSLRPRWHANPT